MVFSSSGMLLICHASLVFLLRVTKFLCIVNEFSKTGNSWFILQFKIVNKCILSIQQIFVFGGGARSAAGVSLDIKTKH